eukprot:gene20772-biopygen10137
MQSSSKAGREDFEDFTRILDQEINTKLLERRASNKQIYRQPAKLCRVDVTHRKGMQRMSLLEHFGACNKHFAPKNTKSGLKDAPQRRGYTRSLPMGPIDDRAIACIHAARTLFCMPTRAFECPGLATGWPILHTF